MKAYTILLFALISSCSTGPTRRLPSGDAPVAPDYQAIFKTARELLALPIADKAQQEMLAPVRAIPENYVIEALSSDPELLNQDRSQLIAELEARAPHPADPTKHTRLIPPAGFPGYSELQLYVTHPYYQGKRLVAPSNLIEVWKRFILSAKKEIIVNVFDFDLEEIAEALIAQARKGLSVRVGIDKKNVIDVRPEVQAVADRLSAGGVLVTGVNPVGLNHQKLTAIDWSDPALARALFSSGNLTRSCLDPEGDLKGTRPLPVQSIPNANHLITVKSWPLANLIQHELTKTLDPSYLLRGRQYPLNGSYQVTGPGVDPQTLEAYPQPSVVITFSPGGALDSINENLIAQVIRREQGPIRMLQFAYSAAAVDTALRERAQSDYQKTGKFDFLSVGDTPFAMREWSRFLLMSGLKRDIKATQNAYQDDPQGAWASALSPQQLADLRTKVFVAPKLYGNHSVKVAGKSVKVSSKIHHKILATQHFAILGTSFNFSEGAEDNNEQILVFRDDKLAQSVAGMVRYMVEHSPGTVANEAQRRNRLGAPVEATDDVEDGSQTKK